MTVVDYVLPDVYDDLADGTLEKCDCCRDAVACGFVMGAAVVFGIMGMVDAIREREADRILREDMAKHDCTCPSSWGADYCDCYGCLAVPSPSNGDDHG
jgi:hypothetical protein